MNFELLGKLHPFMVHFPIGIIPVIIFFHILFLLKKDLIKPEAYFYLWILASFTSLLAVLFGWINLNGSGLPESEKEELHESLGYFIAFLCVVNLVLWKLILQQKKLYKAYIISLTVLTGVLAYGGHLGAELTHGSLNPLDFFSSPTQKKIKTEKVDIITGGKTTLTISFQKQIVPILQEYCNDCHGPKKQKGRLRLDTYAYIFEGGKNGEVIKTKKPEESELYARVILPEDDEDVMPSKGDLLNEKQIGLLKEWILQGAKNN